MRIKVSCTRCLPSCPSPLPRSASCRKTAVARSPGARQPIIRRWTSKQDQARQKLLPFQTTAVPLQLLSDLSWCATRCYKVLQGATRCYKVPQGTKRCYKVLQGTCQVIPLHLEETQVAKRHLQLQPDNKTTTSPIRCHSNYFLICLSVQQCAATCFSTSKKHKLQKHIWRQDYCWPNQVPWSKQHQENDQTNQPVTIRGTLWYSQIIESSFYYWTIGRPPFKYPPQLTEIHIYACSRNTDTDGLNKWLVEC